MAYVIRFSHEGAADCFHEAAAWLSRPEQRWVYLHAAGVEVQVDDKPGSPDVYALTLCYEDGNEPPGDVELAVYRAEHGRVL